MLPGVPRQGIHTAVALCRTDCLTRIGLDRCSHAARYSAYLLQSCSRPCASSGRLEVLSPRVVVGTSHDPPMSTPAASPGSLSLFFSSRRSAEGLFHPGFFPMLPLLAWARGLLRNPWAALNSVGVIQGHQRPPRTRTPATPPSWSEQRRCAAPSPGKRRARSGPGHGCLQSLPYRKRQLARAAVGKERVERTEGKVMASIRICARGGKSG